MKGETYFQWDCFSINEGAVPNIYINLRKRIFYLRTRRHRFSYKWRKWSHERMT